jgi:hypothetical protein
MQITLFEKLLILHSRARGNPVPPLAGLKKAWIPASLENTPNISPPLAGGDEGEGERKLFTPTLSLPHQRGRGIN